MALGIAAVALLAAAGLELRKEPCDRLFNRSAASASILGDEITDRLSRVSAETRVFAFETPDPYTIVVPGGRRDEWKNVQAGIQTILPQLGVTVLSRPYWETTDDSFLRSIAAANPGMARLDGEDSSLLPEFLIFQDGGGVDGLLLQIAVLDTGEVFLWTLERDAEHAALPEPQLRNLSPADTQTLFDIAHRSGLPEDSRAHWRCRTLDGRSQAFVLSQGGKIGRMSFLTNHPVAPELIRLKQLLLAHFDLEESQNGYTWWSDG